MDSPSILVVAYDLPLPGGPTEKSPPAGGPCGPRYRRSWQSRSPGEEGKVGLEETGRRWEERLHGGQEGERNGRSGSQERAAVRKGREGSGRLPVTEAGGQGRRASWCQKRKGDWNP